MNNVRVVDFYTTEPEPLKTNKAILFKLVYQNTGATNVSSVPSKFHLGERIQDVNLPGILAGETKTINVELTNNITVRLSHIGVSISDNDLESAFKQYTWEGIMDIRYGEAARSTEPVIEGDKVSANYVITIANYGTIPIDDAIIHAYINSIKLGSVRVSIDARRLINLTLPVSVTPGLVNITLEMEIDGIIQEPNSQQITVNNPFELGMPIANGYYDLTVPAGADRLSRSIFGWRDRVLSHNPLEHYKTCPTCKWHNGVDIYAVQNTPVRAVADGKIEFYGGANTAYGISTTIKFTGLAKSKFGDGSKAKYQHLTSRAAEFPDGSDVKKGDIIGYTGNTGTGNYGQHLHFELFIPTDPDRLIITSNDSAKYVFITNTNSVDPAKYFDFTTLTM